MKKLILYPVIASLSLLMSCSNYEEHYYPNVTTGEAKNVSYTSVDLSFSVSANGAIKEYGILYGTDPTPTLENSSRGASPYDAGSDYTLKLSGLAAGTQYYYLAYALDHDENFVFGETKSFTTLQITDLTDLSKDGTANCYIVSAAGNYSFTATVIGNGSAGLLPAYTQAQKKFHTEDVKITPVSAALLWQDASELITNVSYSGGKVSFTASSDKGNAVIAVYSGAGGTGIILWSWHIWCTDQPATQNYINAAGSPFTLLDRNLGATSASVGEASYGLHYQWGRKDPFARNSSNLSIASTSTTNGTISNSISHPTTFYSQSNSPYDWHYTTSGTNVANNYLWGNPEGYNTTYTAAKSIYDPCPPGYMVAPKDTWTYFSTSTGTWNGTGYTFSTNSGGGATWYPAAGWRRYDDVILDWSGSDGRYWSSSSYTSSSIRAGYLWFYSVYLSPLSSIYRAGGLSVRCLSGEEYSNTSFVPTVTASDASAITASSATVGGEVTSIGSASLTERGIVYSTSTNPTTASGTKIASTIAAGSDGLGTFTIDLAGLTSGTTYYYRAYATNTVGTAYSEEKSFTTTSSGGGSDLSASGTANCYIVTGAGDYHFTANIIGNGTPGLLPQYTQTQKRFHTESVSITPQSARVLWMDTQDLITNVSYSGGKVSFTASSAKGNAVIAVYSGAGCTGTILWSWHIWCTDAPSNQNYTNNVGVNFTLLDRNLGATAASPGLASYGLLYQWGRKDPFPGSADVASNVEKTLYGAVSSITKTTTLADNQSIAHTIASPFVFYISYSSSDYDWYYGAGSGYANRNNYLWGNPEGYNTSYTNNKSIYDPCPSGYMVAPKDTWTKFTITGNWSSTRTEFNVTDNSESYFTTNHGWTFYTTSWQAGTTSWYPAAGYRHYGDGSLFGSGSYGIYWGSSPYGSGSTYAGGLDFDSGRVGPLDSDYRAYGFSVRCSRVP